MKPLFLLLVAWIGYVAGTSDWRVRPGLGVATVLLACVSHVVIRAALPPEALEQFASRRAGAVMKRRPGKVVQASLSSGS